MGRFCQDDSGVGLLDTDTETPPSALEATLTVAGVQQLKDTVAWNSACKDQYCRIALTAKGARFATSGTGLFRYAITVKTIGGPVLTATDSGSVIVVDRRTSPYGSGWWLDGVEQLMPAATGSSNFLWVGGDGSARIYAKQSATVWTAASVDHPDSLIKTTDGADSVYRRLLPQHGYVEFNGLYRHIKTVNCLGHVAQFAYGSNGAVDSISMPVPVGTTPPAFVFHYTTLGGGRPALTSVDAPPVNGSSRTVTVGYSSAGADTSFTDPDGSVDRFHYGSTTLTRLNPLGDSTTYFFDAAGTLERTRIAVSSSPSDTTSIHTTFCAAESAGNNACATGLVDLDSVYTLVNGPRQDTTVFKAWIDRFGAPLTTRDALGDTTQITYDATWPGLASSVTDPLGHTVRAYYNARGNPDSVVDVNPLGGSAGNAATKYEYATGTDWLTKITGPTGEYATFTVDTSTGNRLTASNGSADSTTETFAYYTSGVGKGLVHTSAWPDGATTTLAYDALGNADTVQTPKGYHTYQVRDAVGRDVVVKTQLDSAGLYFRRDSTGYDVMGRPTLSEAIGAALNGASQRATTQYYYDKLGRDTATSISMSPDSNGVGTITTRTHYDALGRVVASIAADGKVDSAVFDPSGNPITQITRLGGTSHPITMTYDAMNRLRRRSVPSYTYDAEAIGLGAATSTELWAHTYPVYPNAADSAYTVAEQVDTLAYDAAGRVILANNGDAQVARTYFPNGLIATDTERVRTLADTSDGGDFTHHVYGISYQYDLAGRPTGVTVPEQLAPRVQMDSLASVLMIAGSTRTIADQITYSYDAGAGTKNTGRLTAVSGLLPGETVAYGYTPRGQVASATAMNRAVPDGPSPRRIDERWGYDVDGVVRTDTVLSGSGTDGTLRAESFLVDAGGRVLSDSDGTTWRGIMPTQIAYSYSGLGQVLTSYAHSTSPDGLTQLNAHETMTYDAMGNWVHRTNVAALNFGAPGASNFQSSSVGSAARYAEGTGRLRGQTLDANRTDTLIYDDAGNQHAMLTVNAGDTAQYNERVSYYGVDGQLAAADARSAANGGTAVTGHLAFEEYRYDALGRRVLAWARRWCDDATNTSDGGDGTFCDVSAVRRTVWNGSSELAEIQMPATDSTPADTVENDTLAIARWRGTSVDPTYDANRLFGRVLYVDGLATDQPVFITRVNYADASDPTDGALTYAVYAPFSIYPLWNSQGRADRAVLGGGAEPGAPADSLCVGGTARCAEVAFDRGLFPYARSGSDDGSWEGTLLVDKPNATGTYYRRNRNYDPNTARFTQEDPIGLAGGINRYGFANGDPVAFSDPFGLCGKKGEEPCAKPDGPTIEQQKAMVDGITKIGDAVTQFFLFGMLEGAGSNVGVGSDAEAAATADMRSAVMDKAMGEGRAGFQLTAGAVTGEEFSAMASRFLGRGARLSSNGEALVSADETAVVKLPAYKRYGNPTVGRLQGNLVITNSAGKPVINAHIPIKLGPAQP